MRQRYNQTILFGIILTLLTTSLLGCKNSGEAKEEKAKANLPDLKPIIEKEEFHLFRETMDGVSQQWLLSDSLSAYATLEEINKGNGHFSSRSHKALDSFQSTVVKKSV